MEVMQHILPISPRAQGLRNEMAVASALSRYELERINVPTLVIAAADTSAAGKTAADALCTGAYTLTPKTGDQDTINAAIAVVAALPGGGTIVLLEGTYQITGPIRLKTKVRLSGVGLSSRLKVPDGATDAGAFNVIENEDRTAGNSDMAVMDLSIDGRAATNTGTGSHGISWWAPVRGLIERVSIQSCAGHGVVLAGDSGHPIWYATIRGCAVDSCRGIGIWWNGNGWDSWPPSAPTARPTCLPKARSAFWTMST
jgi:hypothetical protein